MTCGTCTTRRPARHSSGQCSKSTVGLKVLGDPISRAFLGRDGCVYQAVPAGRLAGLSWAGHTLGQYVRAADGSPGWTPGCWWFTIYRRRGRARPWLSTMRLPSGLRGCATRRSGRSISGRRRASAGRGRCSTRSTTMACRHHSRAIAARLSYSGFSARPCSAGWWTIRWGCFRRRRLCRCSAVSLLRETGLIGGHTRAAARPRTVGRRATAGRCRLSAGARRAVAASADCSAHARTGSPADAPGC